MWLCIYLSVEYLKLSAPSTVSSGFVVFRVSLERTSISYCPPTNEPEQNLTEKAQTHVNQSACRFRKSSMLAPIFRRRPNHSCFSVSCGRQGNRSNVCGTQQIANSWVPPLSVGFEEKANLTGGFPPQHGRQHGGCAKISSSTSMPFTRLWVQTPVVVEAIRTLVSITTNITRTSRVVSEAGRLLLCP